MSSIPGLIATKNGGLIIHPTALATAVDNGIKIPQITSVQGAGFGDTITDSDRQFASEREPIAINLTYGVAADITEKWFTINDPDTEEADPALDRAVQDTLAQLKFKTKLTRAIGLQRVYGWSLIVGAFTDATDLPSLIKPLKPYSELKQLGIFQKSQVRVVSKDDDPMSPRYLQPVIYELNRGAGVLTLVHFSRCVLVCDIPDTTAAMLTDDSHSLSVLDCVWDDVTCGRNIRWGAAQWLYRNGGGFPVIGFPAGTTIDQLTAYAASGAFSNLMSRTFICTAQNSLEENNGMTFDFKGSAGVALDPMPFFKTNIEQISIATGIPQAKLIGAQAGAVTGSEVNMQDYYKIISRCQSALEDVVRWVIDRLAESGQITLVSSSTASDKVKAVFARVFGRDFRHKTARTYTVEWNSAFELSEKDEASIEESHVRANQGKLDYMSKDEVRAEEGLDPLPNGAGEWKEQPQGLQLFGNQQQENPNNKPEDKTNVKNEEQKQMDEADKFLLIDLNPKPKAHKHVDKPA